MKTIKIIIAALLIAGCFVSCKGNAEPGSISETGTTEATDIADGATNDQSYSDSLTTTESPKSSETTKKSPTSNTTKKDSQHATTAKDTQETLIPTKKNDMTLVYDKDNKFIKAVVELYKCDPALLVGLYSPSNEAANSVWEFSGKKDANGKLIRTKDTLKYVYTFSSDGKCERSGKGSPVFWATEKYIIKLYEADMNS